MRIGVTSGIIGAMGLLPVFSSVQDTPLCRSRLRLRMIRQDEDHP